MLVHCAVTASSLLLHHPLHIFSPLATTYLPACLPQVQNTFVNLTLQDNFFSVGTTPLAAAPGGGGAFTADLSGTIVNGTVISASQFTGTEVLSMVGLSSTNVSAITAAAQVRCAGQEAAAVDCTCSPCMLPGVAQACSRLLRLPEKTFCRLLGRLG